jgi:hypothetical protein
MRNPAVPTAYRILLTPCHPAQPAHIRLSKSISSLQRELFPQDPLLAAIPAAPKNASLNPSTGAVPVGTGCRWLFLGASRNRCTMEDCGRNEKRRGRIEIQPRLLFWENL